MSTFTLIAKAAGSAEATENTLAAVEAALSARTPPWVRLALEVDVRLSADGVPVVIHDARLERTTDGRGLVCEHTLSGLRSLRAGPDDERIPVLEEVFEVARDQEVILEVHDGGLTAPDRLRSALRRLSAQARSRAIIASEHGRVIAALRASEPDLRTAATKGEAYRKLIASLLHVPEDWGPRGHTWMIPARHLGVEVASPRFVRSARRFGDDVWVFVVDDPTELRRLRALGVTGCFTTRPSALSEALLTIG